MTIYAREEVKCMKWKEMSKRQKLDFLSQQLAEIKRFRATVDRFERLTLWLMKKVEAAK